MKKTYHMTLISPDVEFDGRTCEALTLEAPGTAEAEPQLKKLKSKDTSLLQLHRNGTDRAAFTPNIACIELHVSEKTLFGIAGFESQKRHNWEWGLGYCTARQNTRL
jgi:hypothetical protein